MLLLRNNEAQWNLLLQNFKSSHDAYKLLTNLAIHMVYEFNKVEEVRGSTVFSTKLLDHFPGDQLISKL